MLRVPPVPESPQRVGAEMLLLEVGPRPTRGHIGRQVAGVVNFPPRQIGKFMSEVLTLGFPDEHGNVVLFAPDKRVPDGARLF